MPWTTMTMARRVSHQVLLLLRAALPPRAALVVLLDVDVDSAVENDIRKILPKRLRRMKQDQAIKQRPRLQDWLPDKIHLSGPGRRITKIDSDDAEMGRIVVTKIVKMKESTCELEKGSNTASSK